jgi:fluoride exporter
MMKGILLVFFGGGIGSALRYGIQRSMQSVAITFPWGTFIVNIIGCLLIGILWGITEKQLNWNEEMKLLLMTGLCGGFTTFSAYSLEGISLLKDQRVGTFILYITATVIICLVATYLGIRLVK